MPLYEYQCKQCGHRFEKIQSFSAPEIKECPVCRGEVEKMISAPAFQFKGSGWYVSDYGKGGAAGSNTKPEAKSNGEASSSSVEGASGGGESKKSGESATAKASSSADSGGSSGSGAAPAPTTSTTSKKD